MLPNWYQQGEEFACARFIPHSFDLIMTDVEKQKKNSFDSFTNSN